MSGSEKIVKVLHMVGQDEKKTKLLQIMLNLLIIMIAVGITCSIVMNRNKHDQTVQLNSANDLNFVIIMITTSFRYSFKNKNMQQLLKIMDSKLPNYNMVQSNVQKQLISKSNIKKGKTLHTIAILVSVTVVTVLLLPVITGIYMHVFENEKNVHLPLPINVWYPKYDTIPLYALIYVLQCVYYVYALMLAYCALGAIACSFQSINLDMKLFCMKLSETDACIRSPDKHSFTLRLQEYTKYVIRCHQQILRYVKKQTNAVSLILTVCNETICFQMCVYLFMSATVIQNIEKISYMISVLSQSMFLFIYCDCGQNVINGNEEVRNALYECSWLDKPEWFKKDLQIMMAMANKPLHVKPYGLYVLNVTTFTNVINAAYTYFNMLRTLKK